MKTKIKRKAFTLAEVLITLTIIGVVAAVTVPTLTKKTGNQEVVTRLQKVYSTLSQATDEIILEYGNPKTWASNTNDVYEIYKTHLRNAKECGSETGCFKQDKIKSFGKDSYLNAEHTVFRRLILADGVQILFNNLSSTCAKTIGGSKGVCTHILVDVNGQKLPNIIGHDVFYFVLKETGLYPSGCDEETTYDCRTGGAGYACTCEVLNEF